MFGGLVIQKGWVSDKVRKTIDPTIMAVLSIITVYSAISNGLLLSNVMGLLLLGIVTYVSINTTTKLIPEAIRHTWISGLVLFAVGLLVGNPMLIVYICIGVVLVTADITRHSLSGRSLIHHSANCEMVSR